jgi:hypothetical protein
MPANSSYSFSAGQILTSLDLNAVFAQTVAFAADSSNANTGTLPAARLPYSMDQSVATTSNVVFRDAVFTGNLTVSGTTTYVNTNVLQIKDTNIQIAYNAANSSQANGGGINIGGANVNFYYDDSSNNMILDRILSIGNSTVNAVFGYSASSLSGGLFLGNVNNYFQVYIYNSNAGINASSDLALYNDAGTSTNNFIDIGIDSSAYSNASWTITGPNDGYLYTGAGNLAIGTVARSTVKFFSNGALAVNEAMHIDAGANVNIGNTKAGSTSLTVGNGTVNTVVTSTAVQVGNNVANTLGSYPESNTVGTALGSATKRWIINANTINASGLITGSSGADITGTSNASVSMYVGANVYMNLTTHFVGNSTVNTSIQAGTLSVNGAVVANNSGVYAAGIVNAATIQASATFTANSTLVNAAAVNITGQVNTATLYAATSANIGSYFTVNSTSASKTVNSSFSGANLYVNTTNTAFASNTTLGGTNTTITSNLNVTGSITGVTANLSTSVNSALISVGTNFIANTSGMYHTATANANSFTTTGVTVNTSAVAAGANVYINATAVFVGSNTQYANVSAGQIVLSGNSTNTSTINSTAFTGTANNASYLGNTAAANFVQNSDSRTLSGNLYFTGANISFSNSLYIGANTVVNTSTVFIGNSTVNTTATAGQITFSAGATVNGSIYTGIAYTANNATNLGGVAAANFIANTTSGLVANASGTFINSNTGIVANSAGLFVNAAYINTISANNAAYLGGTAAANYLTNTGAFTISGIYTYNANVVFSNGNVLIANGGFGTQDQVLISNGSSMYWGAFAANNAVNLVGANGYSFLQNTDSRTLSGNLNFTGANITFSNTTGIRANGAFGSAGQALTTNGSAVYWSTIVGTNTAAQYTWSNTQTFQNTITFSTSILANTINATSMKLGNTTITANQITLNGSNVVTQATALKIYDANNTQVFP